MGMPSPTMVALSPDTRPTSVWLRMNSEIAFVNRREKRKIGKEKIVFIRLMDFTLHKFKV